jgi:hypothetical protein
MVNTSADDVDSMLDDPPIVLPKQGREMREHTPRPLPPAPAPWPQTHVSYPRTLETHPLSWLKYLGFVILQKPRPAVPTVQEAEAAGNTSDVDVDQLLLIELAGGGGLPDVPLPDVPLPDVPLHERLLVRRGVNQTSRCGGGHGCCVQVRVGFLSCSVPLF